MRILVAMSGGVDSSVAAALLAEQGQQLVGVFMRNGVGGGRGSGRSCCSLSDARDARAVADRLEIPFYAHDLSRPFARLIDAFARDYAAGLTPNPCVLCNNDLKFGELLELATDLECDVVATGHYARGGGAGGGLRRARDRHKDQSYLLHGLRREQLERACFPLGELTKTEVREHARRLSLAVADKPDSADICFVPEGDYRAVVAERLGHQGTSGAVVDGAGRVVGRHGGVAGFTVGQRRGLGVALGHPAYVTGIDARRGEVRVGARDELRTSGCLVGAVNRLVPWADGERVEVQLRHHHEPEAAYLHEVGDGHVGVRFEEASEDVTPGQYAVFYTGERVLGGGRILRAEAP